MKTPVIGLGRETARRYGRIRGCPERRGAVIGADDTWIAAQAPATDAAP